MDRNTTLYTSIIATNTVGIRIDRFVIQSSHFDCMLLFHCLSLILLAKMTLSFLLNLTLLAEILERTFIHPCVMSREQGRITHPGHLSTAPLLCQWQ